MQISYFKKIKDPNKSEELEFILFVDNIKTGYWQDIVLDVRNNKKQKTDAPLVCVSGIFKRRSVSGLEKHSNLIAIDFDAVENIQEAFEKLAYDAYTHFIFRSISGKGICVIVKIDGKKHKEAFEGLSEYYLKKYNLLLDIACKDVSRARFVSWDPAAVYNDKSLKFSEYPEQKKVIDTYNLPFVPCTNDDIDFVIEQITSRQVNIAQSYADWRNIGFALADALGSNGENHFRAVSAVSAKYRPDSQAASEKAIVRQWNACLKAAKSGITIKTFFYYAKQSGLKLHTPISQKIINSAYVAKKSNRSVEAVLAQLEKMDGITREQSEKLVMQVFENEFSIDTSKKDTIITFIKDNFDLKYNEITENLEEAGVIVDARRKNSMYLASLDVLEECKFDFFDRVLKSEIIETYNPLKSFINSLSKNYNKPIETLSKCLISNIHSKEYIEKFLKRWLVGVVGGVFGKPSPLAIVFTGKKQIGKTWFFRNLLPAQINPYFAETDFNQKKDDLVLLTKNLILFIDEWRSINEKDPDFIKYLITSKVFDIRKAYREDDKKYNRIASLCGTSNHTEVIVDTHNNRRIIPIELSSIDWTVYNSVDKSELLAEAYDLFMNGYSVEVSSEEMNLLNDLQSSYEVAKKEKDLLLSYFSPEPSDDSEILTTTEILIILEKQSGLKNLSIKTLGQELRAAGFQRERTLKKNWGYLVAKY